MQILNTILPVIAMLLVGIICRKKHLLGEGTVNSLQNLVMYFTLPANLFAAFYKNPVSSDTLVLPVILFVLTAGGIFAGKMIAKFTNNGNVYFPFMMTGYEAGMLGYVMVGILLGTENITQFAIADVGHSIAIFTIYTAMCKAAGGSKQTLREAVAGLLKTPVLIAILAGILLGNTGIGKAIDATPAGTLIDTVCGSLSGPTSFLILTVIGYRMNFADIKWKDILSVIGCRLLLQGIFAVGVFAILHACGGTLSDKLTVISMAIFLILPPPYILPIMAKDEKSQEFYSSAITVYTLLSLLAFAAITVLVLR